MSHTFTVCSHCQSLNKVQSEKATEQSAVCGKCGKKLELHGLVSHVDTQGMERIVAKSDLPVVVDFWASWCGPCRQYGPEFEKASTHANAVFLKVNTETEQALAQRLGIRGIPCTIVFKNGRELKRKAGAMSAGQVIQWLNA